MKNEEKSRGKRAAKAGEQHRSTGEQSLALLQ
jgi:hypothetical protein